MKFIVRALSVDLTVEPHSFTPARDETVDTASNSIFKDCETIRDVEIAYEDFWNVSGKPAALYPGNVRVGTISPMFNTMEIGHEWDGRKTIT